MNKRKGLVILSVVLLPIIVVAYFTVYVPHRNKQIAIERQQNLSEQLVQAIRIGDMKSLKSLLDQGADPNTCQNIETGDGWKAFPALIMAVESAKPEGPILLLDKGANVNIENSWRETSLMSAAAMGKIKMVKLLISRGADVNHRNNVGNTALSKAREEKHQEVVDILIKSGAK